MLGTHKIDEMAARRLAAIGDMFLSSFDDAGSKGGNVAVLMGTRHRQHEATDGIAESSISTVVRTGEVEDETSGSSREQTANGPEVFEFDSKAVHPEGGTRRRHHQHGVSNGRHGASRGVSALGGTADSDPVSTWTGSRSELSILQRQVQTYGAAALHKKAKKQFDATQLAKLGARAEKAQRMPASVGKGLKRKHTDRAERAQEEAVEAGHLSRQAIAKVRRKQKATGAPKRDAGLGEQGSSFRRGVLRVSGKSPGGKPRAKANKQQRG